MSVSLNPKRALILSFLTAFVTLATQILVHRIISAKLLNNYAFLVISLTMLGFALSGVFLSKVLERLNKKFVESVNLCASLFGVSLLGASFLFYKIHLGDQLSQKLSDFFYNFLINIPLALLFALPFFFCGLLLGLLLSSPHFPTRKIYFADLMGSALGAILVLPSLSFLSVEQILILCVFLLVLGTFLLFPPSHRGLRFLTLIVLFWGLASGYFSSSYFRMTYPQNSMLASPYYALEYTEWDPISRIELSTLDTSMLQPERIFYKSLIGPFASFHKIFKKVLTQNNFAFTFALDYDGNPQSLKGIDETIYAAGYQASSVPHPKVITIGVGGGFDVLTALYFKAEQIIGVEINGATLNILKKVYASYFKNWVQDPRVSLIHAEGRYYLENSPSTFDIIQLSGVDTYSGTAASANIFSENYLYTREALALYFSKLSDAGILNIMRLEYLDTPREMLRILTTAKEILRASGISEPERHLVLLSGAPQANFTAMLLKKTPFKEEELQRLVQWTNFNPFIKISGIQGAPSPLSQYQRFLNLQTPQEEQKFIQEYPLNIQPVSDDQPFFFRYTYWKHLFTPSSSQNFQIYTILEYSLLLLLGIIGLLTLFCIYLPLRYFLSAHPKPPSLWKYALILASLGLGFLAFEIALMQKFGLFLGHPNYAISTVLSSLLFATGLGSLSSEWFQKKVGELRFLTYSLAFLVFTYYFFLFPWLPQGISLSFALKQLLVFSACLPLGLLLGVFLPSVLDSLKQVSPAYVPWAWGINGIFSVLAPLCCVSFSMSYGMSALWIAGIPFYLLVGFLFPAPKSDTASPSLKSESLESPSL